MTAYRIRGMGVQGHLHWGALGKSLSSCIRIQVHSMIEG
jgi:hypothetical protein